MADKKYTSRVEEAKRRREEGLKKSSSGSKRTTADDIGRRRLGERFGIDTFETDLRDMGNTISNIYSGWQTQETMKNTRASVEAMHERIGHYQNYQKRYGGSDLTEVRNSYQTVLDQWDDRTTAYGNYQNADAYNKAVQKLKFDEQFSKQNEKGEKIGLSFDEVRAEMEKYGEGTDEYEYLKNYTNYSNLNDFDKAINYLSTAPKTEEEESDKYFWIKDDKFPAQKNDNKIVDERFLESYKGNVTNNKLKQENLETIEALEKAKNQYKLDYGTTDYYEEYFNAEDFDELSQYVTTREIDKVFGFIPSNHLDFGDKTYEYINNVDGVRDEMEKEHRIMGYDTGNTTMSQEDSGYHKLNENEKKLYNYLHEKDKVDGTNLAQEYLDDMEVALTKRVFDEQSQSWKASVENPVLATIGSLISIPANIYGSAMGSVEALKEKVEGKEYNPYGYYKSGTALSSDIRQYVGENIAESTEGLELFGVNVPSFLYQTGMSIGDTVIGGATMGTAYSVVAGSGAFQQKAREMKEAGESEDVVFASAFASGIAEAAFEYISLDKLINIKSVDGWKKAFTESLKQAGIEGSEELATELANIYFDKVIRGQNSDLAQLRQSFIDRGFTEEEADKKVKEQTSKQLGEAFAGGFMSGSTLGTGQSVTDYSVNKSTGEMIRANGSASQMVDMFDTMEIQGLTPEESEAYKLYGQYFQKKDIDSISNAKLGNLYNTALREADADLRSRKTTDLQKKNAASRIYSLSEMTREKTVDEKARLKRVEELKKGEETKVDGKSVSIEGIKIEDGSTIVLTSQGEHKAEDMTFSSNDAEILAYAENMGAEKGSLFVKNYDGKQNVDSYFKSFDMAYTYGEDGIGVDNAIKNKGVLTEKQVAEIYTTAIKQKAEARQKAIDDITAKYSAKTIKKGTFDDSIIAYDSKNTDGAKVNWNTLTSKQREAIRFAKAFSKATGVNIVFTKSKIKNGKHKGENGSYDPKTNTITLDVYAGRMDASTAVDAIIPTLSHEVTHWMKAKAPEMYSKLQEKVMNTLGLEDGMSIEDRIDYEVARIKRNHPENNVTPEDAIDEIVARACEDMLSNSEKAREFLSALSEKEQKSFMEKVEEIFNNLLEWVNNLLSQYKSESEEAEILRKYEAKLKEAQKLWDEAFAEAVKANQALNEVGTTAETQINKTLGAIGLQYDGETKSVAPQMSERTWTESGYVVDREKAIENLSKALGVSKKKAEKYVDSINSVAKLIADDRARLDYDSNMDENASVMKPNSDYKWSVDMSTLCAKRLLFTGTFDAIQRMLPNTALDSDDIVKIRKMMMDKGYQVACGICYVESTRREIGTITQDFIERYKEAQKNGTAISRINSKGKPVLLQEKGTKKNFYTEDGYTPTLAELNTTDIDLVKRDHPEVYGAYLSYMNARGQAKPKLLETRAEYKGEIAKTYARKKNGELNSSTISMNESGGLRLQSFSDFEIAHLIDMMQVVMDMSNVGLMSQAYTKVPEFAEVFGGTGVKINLSLIAKGDGLDVDGNLIFDDIEGINHLRAFELRDKFSKNVGTILVGKNDAHIIKAMADPRIDYIIPFHKSSWKESLYDALGLTGYADYTDTQHEKAIDPDRKISDFKPSEYWDFTKSGDENGKIYLEKCKADGRIPKFPQFAQYDGYWKLLIDFKMYDNDGVGSPQTSVMPEFDMEAANRILNDYEGGHRSFPVAKDIVNEFVDDYKKNHPKKQYSDRDSSGKELTQEQIEFFKESEARDENGRLLVGYHGTSTAGFNVFDFNRSKGSTGFGVMKKRNVGFFTTSKRDADSYGGNDYKGGGKIYDPIEVAKTHHRKAGSYKVGESLRFDTKEDADDFLKKYPMAKYYVSFDKFNDGWFDEDVIDAYAKDKGYDIEDAWYDRDEVREDMSDDFHKILVGYRRYNMAHGTVITIREFLDNYEKYSLADLLNAADALDPNNGYMDSVWEGYSYENLVDGMKEYMKNELEENETDIGDVKFTAKAVEGSEYTTEDKINRRTYACYFNIKKPFVKDYKGRNAEDTSFYDDLDSAIASGEYDGVIAKNVKVGRYKDNGTVICPFDPNQVKLTTNTNPTGKPDIRYSDRDSRYKTDNYYLKITPASRKDAEKLNMLDDRNIARYRKEIDGVFDGSLPIGSDVIIGMPSEVLLEHGVSNRLIHMTQNIVRKIAYPSEYKIGDEYENTRAFLKTQGDMGGKHNLGISAVKNLPLQIAQPIAITKNNDANKGRNSVVLWTNWIAEDGKGIMLGLVIDGNGATGLQNNVSTVFQATNEYAQRFFDNEEDILYPKNKKDINQLLSSRRYMPRAMVDDTFIKNITQKIPGVKYSDRDIDDIDSRTLLANALESVAKNADEKAMLTEYRKNIDIIGIKESELSEIKAEIKELSFAKGKRDTQRLDYLRNRAEKLQNSINYFDKKLLGLEAAEPLKNVITREKARVRKLAYEKNREYTKKYMTSYKENVEKKAKVESIKQKALMLEKWLRTPSKDKHIPDDLKEPVRDFLSAIDFASRNTGIDTSGQSEALAKLSSSVQDAKKSLGLRENLTALQMATSQSEEFLRAGVDFSVDIKKLTDSISNMELKSGELFVLKDMSLDDLVTLDKVVTTLRTVIRKSNEYYTLRRKVAVRASAHELFDLLDSYGIANEGKMDGVLNFFNYDNITPINFFDRLGDVGKDLFNAFAKSQDRMAFLAKKTKEFSEGTWTSKDVKQWDSDVIEFEVVDAKKTVDPEKPIMKKVYTTTSRLMTLYLHDKREQSRYHLYAGGGGRFTTFEHGLKTYGEDVNGVALSPELVQQMLQKLDPRAKEVADAISEFLNTFCKDLGNEVTMDMYGTELFVEENYVPIEVIGESVSRQMEKPARSITALLNKGFTKETKPNAHNQIVLDSIFNVFSKHASEMMAYNAFARTVYDAVRLFEYKETRKSYALDKEHGQSVEDNLQTKMKGALGSGAVTYFRNFLEDINGTQIAGRGDNMLGKAFSNSKLANVAWNLNVALLQPLSLIRATTMVNPIHLAMGTFRIRHGIKKAMDNSGVALWKSYGYRDTDISKSLAEQIKNNKTFWDKLKEWSMKAPEIMDEISWGALWSACEYQVLSDKKGIEKGSQKFYDEVVELFEEVVYRTQVMDSVLSRSQIMRHKSTLVKGLTSYMSEPLVTYNMVYGIFSQWNLDSRKGDKFDTCFKRHGKKLATAIGVYGISALAEAGIRTLTTAMKNAGSGDDDDDEVFKEQLIDNLNPLGKIPIAREIVSMLQGYGATSIPGLDTVEAFVNAYKAISKMILEGEEVSYKKVQKILKAISYGSGQGASNATKEVVAIWNLTIGKAYPSLFIDTDK